MKVGIFCSNDNPLTGGGYTFESEIIKAVLELVNETQHSFVIFINSPVENPIFTKSARVQIVKIPDSPESSSKPFDICQRVFFSIVYKLKFLAMLNSTTLARRSKNRFELLCDELGIDMIWFSGGSSISVDLPFIATIWDLQHRLQPFFPEVGQRGIWEEREWYNSRYIQRASVVIAGSITCQKEIELFYQVPSERIKILPHPTPHFVLNIPTKKHQDLLKKYKIPAKYLFYPAQFWSHKNHANLLISLQILKQKHDLIVHLVLVGSDQGTEKYIRSLISKWELSSQVHILGFVPQEDMVELYQNAFALTYMTFFGPDNLPPLEAFALGCPVIASKVSGAEEQLGDAAILVDPKSPEQIAEAIFKLLNSPELQKMLINRGLERAQKWTGQDFVRGVFSILDEFEAVRRCWK
jgi:glycosyltransferase involved in cell wall biosynthesis